jgi:hypothetical protein
MGEQIVMGIDINNDVWHSTLSRLLNQIGIVDICTTKHGTNALPTYARGSTLIDKLFVSKTLLCSSTGYLPVACDHRVLWTDIPYQVAFGRDLKYIPQPEPKRITLQDPRLAAQYNTLLQAYLQDLSFLEKLQKVEYRFYLANSAHAIKEYNALP